MNRPTRRGDAAPICDYEGSDYRTRFWENQGRDYEDLAERIAIRALLPPRGRRLLEVGAGFGRLVDLYAGYQHVILLDYSKSLLRQAQQRLGRSGRYTYVAANLYQMPLVDDLVEAIAMVRVLHHVANVPAALRQLYRVLAPQGTFVLEFASKLHLKSILRYALHRQWWSPFGRAPVEFAALNFDFHPRWIEARLEGCGFEITARRTVSRFRIPLLKRIVPAPLLARLDGALQGLGALWQLTPSVFVRAHHHGSAAPLAVAPDVRDPTRLFRCPRCENAHWRPAPQILHCLACDAQWAIDDGIYDFKIPL